MSDTFQIYGYNFQVKLLSTLFKDKPFLQQITDILDANFFEAEANKWIASSVAEYFTEYKTTPTLDVMKVKIDAIDSDVLKASVIDTLKEVVRNFDADDMQFVKDEALKFCKNQTLKSAIVDSVDLLQRGDYDAIKFRIDEAMKSGTDRDIGHEYMIDIADRFSETTRKTTATGWEVVDQLLDGGLGPGELGVFVAPAGIGKSWGLVNAAANAVKAGKTVIHYTLELNGAYVGLRFDSVFTGIAAQNLKFYQDDIKARVDQLDGDLVIKYFPTKTATVNTLKAHLERCTMLGKKPDLVIVDYADLLRGNGKEIRHELGNIYEDLRGMAGEYEVPIWTASQANRSALDDDVIGAEKIAESYSKIMTADFVLSLSRKIEDKIAGTGRFHVIKNRFGPDGITFPSKMNMSNGQIDIYEQASIQGKTAQGQMDQGSEAMRKRLATKYNEVTPPVEKSKDPFENLQ
ncbi:AAA family ATPase [bacterium]|nr:AAA family ATPase [bacterium]